MRSPTDLEGIARDNTSRELDAQRKQAEQIEDLRTVLSTLPGRRFVWGILADAGVFRSSIAQTDALTNFNEGKRAVGLRVLADISANYPEAYVLMMKEQNNG